MDIEIEDCDEQDKLVWTPHLGDKYTIKTVYAS